MFFQQLSALAENLDVQIRLMKKGESLTVSIVPADATSIKPLSLTGTAAELDEGFLEAISAPISAITVSEQVAAYKKDLQKELEEKKKAATEEVEKKAAAEDAKPAKKGRATKATAKAKEDPKPETPAPAEGTETEKPVGHKEAYAPAETETETPVVQTPEAVADVPAIEAESLPAETPVESTVSEDSGLKSESESETSPSTYGESMAGFDYNSRKKDWNLPAETEPDEDVATETPPVEAEEPASDIVIDALGGTMDGSEVEPEAQTLDNTHNERVERFYGKAGPVITEEPDPLPAEPVAATDPDDSFFAPPPSMHIPFFD